MTNKEFFLKTIKEEAPRFRKAIEALPEDKLNHKVHDRSKDIASISDEEWEMGAKVPSIYGPSADEKNKIQIDRNSVIFSGIAIT